MENPWPSLLPELYTTGTTKEEKDLKKVNLILLVIIHDRWSSRPTNPMHNDLLIGPTYSLWTLHGFPSALSSRKSSPLHSSIRTFRSLSKNLRMKGPPPDRWKALARFSISGSRSCFYRHLAPMEQGSQHCRMTASDWICYIMPASSVGPVGE